MNHNFSENLKKIRRDNHLSQEQLAELLGVSRQAISKWESAQAYPEMDKIIAICNRFHLNIDDLLYRDIKEVKGEEDAKNKLNKYIDDFLKFVTDTIDLFSHMNFKNKVRCLLEQFVIIFVLFILSRLFISVVDSLLFGLLDIFSHQIGYYVTNIIESILGIFCFVVSIIVVIHIFKMRYLDYYSKLEDEVDDTKNQGEKDNKKILFERKDEKIIIRDPKHSEYRFIRGLLKVIVFFIKMFSLWFVFLICLLLIFLFASFIMSFLLYKTGFFFIGLIITILSSSVITVVILLLLLNFVFTRKNDKKKMIWCFIIALITFGIGCGFIFIGTLHFDFVDSDSSYLKQNTLELEMTDQLFFYDSHIEYIESDNNTIKLEYKLNQYCKIDTTDLNTKYGVHIWGYCSNPIKLGRVFIQNLNKKKIIDMNNEVRDIKIYTSRENINKLQSNRDEYLRKQRADNERFQELDREREALLNELNSYKEKNYEYESKINELEREIEEYKKQKEN